MGGLTNQPLAVWNRVVKRGHMNVAAHPMLVAVALGLLGPAALTNDEPEIVNHDPKSEPTAVAQVQAAVQALDGGEGPGWARLSLHSQDWPTKPNLTVC